jgi:hypothetical protein
MLEGRTGREIDLRSVAEALGHSSGPLGVGALRAAIRDERKSSDVRNWALYSLTLRLGGEATSDIIYVIESAKGFRREHAVFNLAVAGDDTAWPLVCHLLMANDRWIKKVPVRDDMVLYLLRSCDGRGGTRTTELAGLLRMRWRNLGESVTAMLAKAWPVLKDSEVAAEALEPPRAEVVEQIRKLRAYPWIGPSFERVPWSAGVDPVPLVLDYGPDLVGDDFGVRSDPPDAMSDFHSDYCTIERVANAGDPEAAADRGAFGDFTVSFDADLVDDKDIGEIFVNLIQKFPGVEDVYRQDRGEILVWGQTVKIQELGHRLVRRCLHETR